MSELRLLFLDFDGVLNSENWIRRRPSKDEFAIEMNVSPEMYDHDRLVWGLRSIDPVAVQALNEIVKRSHARVVVSSSWRTGYALSKLEWLLRRRGFEHHLIGATPDSQYSVPRGAEIAAWITTMDVDVDVKNVVIVDDDEDMLDLSSRLFHTNFDRGLCPDHVDQVVSMFGRA